MSDRQPYVAFPHPARLAAIDAINGAFRDLMRLAEEGPAAVAVVGGAFEEHHRVVRRMLEVVNLTAGARITLATLMELCTPSCACVLHEHFRVVDASLDDALALIQDGMTKWEAQRAAEYSTLRALEAVRAKDRARDGG